MATAATTTTAVEAAAVGTTLFSAQCNASAVLAIDAAMEAVRTIPCGVDGKWKWSGIAAVGTTPICAPYIASVVLVIYTATEAVRTIPRGVDGERKWYGIAAVDTTRGGDDVDGGGICMNTCTVYMYACVHVLKVDSGRGHRQPTNPPPPTPPQP